MNHQSTGTSQRRLIILGSTGSIGCNTLEVVEHLHQSVAIQFDVVGLAAGNNADLLAQQAERFHVPHVALADGDNNDRDFGSISVLRGINAAEELIEQVAQPGDIVLAAMVGVAGLAPVLAAIERGCDIALANKETLVAGGDLVIPRVKQQQVSLLPVDSEHSAVFQCLPEGKHIDEVKRLVLTASGGPFRTWNSDQLAAATVEQALNHPTWDMGAKITIDSATLMNKALEVIEAHWLFGLPADRIDVVIHPQSIVHSFVEFIDGSILAQLGPPDMKTPIQFALTWPKRSPGCSRTMNWSDLQQLDFHNVDHERFGALQLAYQVIESEGTAGTIFNAANEVAVQAFLDRKLAFNGITELVAGAVDAIESQPINSLDDILNADHITRSWAHDQIEKKSRAQTTIAASPTSR